MKNKIICISSIFAMFILVSCGKKSPKNEQKDSIKKDTVRKTEEPKKQPTVADKLGIDIPKDTYTYYGKQKDGYQLLALELDKTTFKRKSIYFKDISDHKLQDCEIVSDKNQGDNDVVVAKIKGTEKQIKIIFPIMGDISINGKKLVPASFFVSSDNRILTSSGGPVFAPFLLGEKMEILDEIINVNPNSQDVKKEDGTYMVYPGSYKGKKVKILIPSQNNNFDKLILVEEGKETSFTRVTS